MRRVYVALAAGMVMATMLAGGAAKAQYVDPSTGIPVDPMTDPVDYANALSGQPTNIGMEEASYAMSQAQAAATQAQTSAQAAMDATTQASAFPPENDSAPAGPAIAVVPTPVMTPNGGSFKGSVQVTIFDKDAKAMVHYTVDGSKPTEGSPIYVAPLTVTAKTKVRAIGVFGGEVDSRVVTKTFKAKS